MGLLGWIVLGLLAGAIAKALHKGDEPGGVLGTFAVGIVGALLGGLDRFRGRDREHQLVLQPWHVADRGRRRVPAARGLRRVRGPRLVPWQRPGRRIIRVAIVDDHHAVRLGLHTALRSEPGLVPAGTAADAAALAPLLYRSRPDIVLLDYNLPDIDGLTVCREIKAEALLPGVILYSAFADGSMTIPAIVAGADGILNKGVPARELFAAIREAVGGGDALPPARPSSCMRPAPRSTTTICRSSACSSIARRRTTSPTPCASTT